ncbi:MULTISPECIES: cobalamin-dependent protein [unclassified Nonomuraea]|uniref:cobalamin B12-binding domain-containing protein n=1 Tax=unclassified Nonomuraea TaxID=2593643 RepID=UPI0033C8FEEA
MLATAVAAAAPEVPVRSGRGHLTVLLSGTSSDAHTWNLVYLQLLLEEAGHAVANLGACVPDDLLIDRCRDLRPDLLVMSSVNGHGRHDAARAARRLRQCPQTAGVPAVIGGKLGIAGRPNSRLAPELLAAGFDRVFGEQVSELLAYAATVPAR